MNTRYPGHFYNLKLGRAWAGLDRRLDMASTLSLCTERPMLESDRNGDCQMGVDTGLDGLLRPHRLAGVVLDDAPARKQGW